MPSIPKFRLMYSHQRRGLAWAESRNKIAIFWEMRLGKTLLAIRWAKKRKRFPALVVCPSDILETWQEELTKEGQRFEVCIGYKSEPKSPIWCLTSYDTLRGNRNLQNHAWTTVILDESTAIRNPKAQITKICNSCFTEVPNKAILAGIPAPESHLEYFCQMKFLDDEFLGHSNFWNFRASLFRSGYNGWKWCPVQGATNQIMHGVNHRANVLTRKQAGIGNKEIKEVKRIQMPVSLNSVYKHAEKQFMVGDQTTMWASVAFTWLARLAGGCYPKSENDYKIHALVDLLKIDFAKEQVVIWCNFNSEIDGISRRLAKLGEKHGIIRGSVKNSDRTIVNHEFQSRKTRILICQPKCAQFGRDFSAASTSIYYSLPWDLKSYLQSSSRIAHPSKKDTLLTLHLVGRNTVDEDIHKSLMVKHDTEFDFRMMLRKNFLERVKRSIDLS